MLGIETLLRRRPGELSGGQRQRVAMGRAIVREPALFLFDEPLSNLDAKLRVHMRGEIRRLCKGLGITSLYVTHDQVEAMTMGSRIVVMRDGVIQQVGEPMSIYNEPANEFVGGFIGTPPMNFFHAEVKDDVPVVLGTPVPLVEEQRTRVADAGITEAIVGIRPEHLLVVHGDGPRLFEADVDLVEPLGAESLLHGRAGSFPFVASIEPSERLHTGDKVPLSVPDGKVTIFDPESKVAIA